MILSYVIFVLKVEILHKNTNRHHPKIPSQNFLKKKNLVIDIF